jgi:hypothetical protein
MIRQADQLAKSQIPSNGAETGRKDLTGTSTSGKKEVVSISKSSGSVSLNDSTAKYPFIADAIALVEWLKTSEGRLKCVELPVEISGYLSQLEGQLFSFGGSNTTISEGGAMEEEKHSDAVGSNIKGMLAVTSTAQKLLRVGAALGGDAFLKVLFTLLRAAVVSVVYRVY